MRHFVGALLLGGTLLGSGAALADASFVVDKVTITGSKTVPAQKLYGLIQAHKGASMTQADVVADQDTITKALGEANVVGGIKTSMATKSNKHIEITFAIDDQGAQAPVVTKVAPKLHEEIFVGNKAIASDKLLAATGWKPGEELSNAKLTAAQQAIANAYKDAKLPLNVGVAGSTQSVGNGQVDVTWTVTETKGKKKPKSDDEGQKLDQ